MAVYGAYIVCMGELYDFTEFKLHQLMESAAKRGRLDIATQISDALNAYLMGEVHIEFIEGWPMAYRYDESDTDV